MLPSGLISRYKANLSKFARDASNDSFPAIIRTVLAPIAYKVFVPGLAIPVGLLLR